MAKYIYFFGGQEAEGNRQMKDLLGGKGANLAEMSNLEINVPPGFTLSTEVCQMYQKSGKKVPSEVLEGIDNYLHRLESLVGKKLGDPSNPLLLSVRSGAAISMPGMMDTILNIGLNPEVTEGLKDKTNNGRFAWDSYRRLIQMFGEVVRGIDSQLFEDVLSEIKEEEGAAADIDLSEEAIKEVVKRFKTIYRDHTGEDFPTDPKEQLLASIEAVFASWNNERARKYRQLHDITGLLGTATNVQTMVFGNMGEKSATGVMFTRDPATGENEIYGEILFNAQGEDVVAGVRTGQHLTALEEKMPSIYAELVEIKEKLEKHYKEMQDLEFTIEEGELFILQTRNGKTTGVAEARIAIEMHQEGLIDEVEATKRITPSKFSQLLHPVFNIEEVQEAERKGRLLVSGLNAGPGAASGVIVFNAETAEKYGKEGKSVILVRHETSPEDIGGMEAADGILTKTGGLTSHAAVVARAMGKTCIVGCRDMEIDYGKRQMTVDGQVLKELDQISLDGTTGKVYTGEIKTQDSEVIQVLEGDLSEEDSLVYRLFSQIMTWADQYRKIGVRANADTPRDSHKARELGAEGIGLCRTEHMFFHKDRLPYFREMILANTEEERRKSLEKLLPFQKEDFKGIFQAMEDLPVTIRLLDPPLHEFLPDEDEIDETANRLGVTPHQIRESIKSHREVNPMLGHRGCRLSLSFPEICEMQVRAILEAACEVKGEGKKIFPEIMVPLVGIEREVSLLKERIGEIAQEVFDEQGEEIDFLVGTMIEVPRACLVAHEIAREADFFSFGTNDLTQMTFGFSRDDISTFLPHYLESNILERDPFASIDQNGVGELMKITVEKGRKTRGDLKIGICGEHGGEASSIAFCQEIGLDYVSCSPLRVPAARLAGAQAALESKEKGNG